jgi:hypothetical protein
MTRAAIFTVLGLGLAAFFAPSAQGNNLFDGHDTCTALNCGSLVIDGKVLVYRDSAGTATDRLPWTGLVYAAKGECLRLHVVQQSIDLAINAVSPETQFMYRNDDSSGAGCPLCPLVKIDPGATGGWYGVVISSPILGTADASFKLRIGRYNTGNPNCAGPTPAE